MEAARVPDRVMATFDKAPALAFARTRTTPEQPAFAAPTAASPGLQVGITTFDMQHNGSTGRQLDKFGNKIQVAWMYSSTFSTGSGRSVYWNKLDVTGSPGPITLADGRSIAVLPLGNLGSSGGQPAFTSAERPGFVTFRNLPTGRGVAFMHDTPPPPYYWQATLDAATAAGVFIDNPAPQPAGTAPGSEVLWPHGTIDVVGSDTILHVVARGQRPTAANAAYYWRGRLTGATSVAWGTPVFLDSLTTVSCVVEQDPSSNRVAIVYTKPRSLSSQINNDVAYFESTDGGLSWTGPINVTNYTDASVDRAFTDVDALYDPSGTLHIVYNTFDYRPGVGTFFSPCDLWHWNKARGTSRVITTVDLGEIGNFCSDLAAFNGGAWNLLLAKPNLVVKPAGAGGIADELLYAVWVQFGPAWDTLVSGSDTLVGDCATRDSAGARGGYVNGEIWISTSSNDGLTWDRPLNLTGTHTPDCLPGDCHSEHWVTAAREADSGVYISYVDDTHAGAVVRADGAEGTWATGSYRVLAARARTPVLEPRIAVSPTLFQELNVAPGAVASCTVFVSNLGNALLSYSVVVTSVGGGASHVQVNGSGTFASSIAAAGASQSLTIAYDGVGLGNFTEHDWRLEITSNDAANDPGQGGTPIDIDLNVFVASPWFACTGDTISTGQHRLAVSSCLELGNKGAGGGLYAYADQSEWIFDASPVIARLDGATRRAYRDIFWTTLADRSRDSNRAFRALSGLTVQRSTTFNGKAADRASGVATTTDSLLKIDWEVVAFRSAGNLAGGAVARYVITNRTGMTYNGLIFGAAADLDVDSQSTANEGIASENAQYVGARGGYFDTSGAIYTPQDHYAALFNIPLDAACSSVPAGGQILDNDFYTSTGAYRTDTLYDVMNRMAGWNASSLPVDTMTDLGAVMVSLPSAGLGPSDTLRFAIGLAVSDVSESDLAARVAALRQALNSSCGAGDCPITLTGDVNVSGTITSADIIGLVNFVFKGGTAPKPCTAAGDVNCNGAVTSSDIIVLVNFVFKGGPPPCNACTSPLAVGC
jgi:hypothetical protein